MQHNKPAAGSAPAAKALLRWLKAPAPPCWHCGRGKACRSLGPNKSLLCFPESNASHQPQLASINKLGPKQTGPQGCSEVNAWLLILHCLFLHHPGRSSLPGPRLLPSPLPRSPLWALLLSSAQHLSGPALSPSDHTCARWPKT